MRLIRPPRLNTGQLAIFSTPVLVAMAIETPWRVYLPAFFSEQLSLSLPKVAALLMWIRLFDVFADPACGWVSDRFNTPIGTRRPWMLLSVPLIVIGTWQVFFASVGVNVWLLAAWCIVMHFGYSLLIVPHGGWGLEISDSPADRTRIMGAKVWFGAAGAPLIVLFPSILEHWTHASRTVQVHSMGWVLMILAPLSVALVLWKIPEVRIEPQNGEKERSSANPFKQFYEILRNPELARILFLYSLIGVAESSSAGTFLFYVGRVLQLGKAAGGLLLLQFAIGLVAIPVWVMISHRVGKRRAMLAVLSWQALTALIPLFLPAGSFGPLIAYLMVRALAWGADYMLLRAMVADVSNADAQASGERRSGSYYALFNVSLKLASGFGIGAALWGLSTFGGFDPHAVQVDEHTRSAISIVFCVPSFCAALLGLAVFSRAPQGADEVATARVASVATA